MLSKAAELRHDELQSSGAATESQWSTCQLCVVSGTPPLLSPYNFLAREQVADAARETTSFAWTADAEAAKAYGACSGVAPTAAPIASRAPEHPCLLSSLCAFFSLKPRTQL